MRKEALRLDILIRESLGKLGALHSIKLQNLGSLEDLRSIACGSEWIHPASLLGIFARVANAPVQVVLH